MLRHSFLRELMSGRDDPHEEDLALARDILDAPLGLAYCITRGYRAHAERSLAQALARSRHEDSAGWRPVEEAPDDLAEGLFAFPDGSGGYQQMVIYGYAPTQRRSYPALYDHRGVQFDPDEPPAMSAKEIAIQAGATQWRPVPPHPPCHQ